jgi:hypothetical protein
MGYLSYWLLTLLQFRFLCTPILFILPHSPLQSPLLAQKPCLILNNIIALMTINIHPVSGFPIPPTHPF